MSDLLVSPDGGTGNPVFDVLLEEAVPHVLAGTHRRDEAPVEGGRWPVSVVASPLPDAVRDRLAVLMEEAILLAGPGHFCTGRPDSVHVTVRALEGFRAAADPGDAVVGRWQTAIERAAARTEPFDLVFTGVTLSRVGVMAQLEPLDDGPWQLMKELRRALGDLAWFEGEWRRDIWYASLLHFAADLADPAGLAEWVRAHRAEPDPVRFTVMGLDLVRFRHTLTLSGEEYMRPEHWSSHAFG